MRQFWKLYEKSYDALQPEVAEKVLNGARAFFRSDPVIEALIQYEDLIQDYDFGKRTTAELLDSTQSNPYWDLGDFYGSQHIIYKRWRDNQDNAWNGVIRELRNLGRRREKRSGLATCSALLPDRSRCPRDAEFVLAKRSKTGNWSYQRRCIACFAKVKDKTKYGPINNGRYFK